MEEIKALPLSIKVIGGLLLLLVSLSVAANTLLITTMVSTHDTEEKAHTAMRQEWSKGVVTEICKVQECTKLVR